eukprot:TRINITY_DN1197_c0_g1_i7.p2 TRINITY_DN1197_c0_g1~~TRINITY_DN1197_c0_g1_i7.p2  ORF type:complete len:513 (-),score=139.33 TRINITY_DN1197_c0_g1_i7:2368-3906(-)
MLWLVFVQLLACVVSYEPEPVALTKSTWRSSVLSHDRSFVLFHRDNEAGAFAYRGFASVAKQDHDPSQDAFFGSFLVQDPAALAGILHELGDAKVALPFMVYIPFKKLQEAQFITDYLPSRFTTGSTINEVSGLRFRRDRDLLQLRPQLESLQKLYVYQHKLFRLLTNEANPKKQDKLLARMIGIENGLSSDSRFAPQVKRVMVYTRKFLEQGIDFLEKEKVRVAGMLAPDRASSISETQKHKLLLQKVAIDAFDTAVPKIVHFIKTDDDPERFTLMHYLAVRSAHHHIKPEKIMFHTVVQPSGKWWEKAKKYVSMEMIEDIPTHIGTTPLRLAAHISDALRYRMMEQYGGIYMDLDVITIKSFDSLLHYPMTLALEKAVPNYEEVVCNAVIMAKPGHPFLDTITKNQPMHFKEGCYSCHSVLMIRDLALWHPEEVNILNWESFYYPGWEEEAYRIMFGSNDPSEVDWSKTFAIHLFASNGNFNPYRHMMDEDYILNNDSNFNRLVRQFLLD